LSKYKVVFLGDSGAGKTSIIKNFIYGSFESSYNATIGIDFLAKTMYLEDRTVRLQIWDSAGQASWQMFGRTLLSRRYARYREGNAGKPAGENAAQPQEEQPAPHRPVMLLPGEHYCTLRGAAVGPSARRHGGQLGLCCVEARELEQAPSHAGSRHSVSHASGASVMLPAASEPPAAGGHARGAVGGGCCLTALQARRMLCPQPARALADVSTRVASCQQAHSRCGYSKEC
jgi:putative hemolysin